MDIFQSMIFAYGTTIAFAVVLQSNKKYFWLQGLNGSLGWGLYLFLKNQCEYNSFEANFCACIFIGLFSELIAMQTKQPATVFVIPSIFPLVPGLGMYLGMSKFLDKNYYDGIETLLNAAGDAAAIALGLMLTTSIFRVAKTVLKPTWYGLKNKKTIRI